MEKIRNDKYKLATEYYGNGIIRAIKIVDDNDKSQCEGKYFHESGKFWYRAFCKDGYFIGKVDGYDENGNHYATNYYSQVKLSKSISEMEYKKELAMIRLGIIKVPALDIKISDYDK